MCKNKAKTVQKLYCFAFRCYEQDFTFDCREVAVFFVGVVLLVPLLHLPPQFFVVLDTEFLVVLVVFVAEQQVPFVLDLELRVLVVFLVFCSIKNSFYIFS